MTDVVVVAIALVSGTVHRGSLVFNNQCPLVHARVKPSKTSYVYLLCFTKVCIFIFGGWVKTGI